MVFNPFIWTADQLLMLGLVPTDLTNQFLTLYITNQGSPGGYRSHFGGWFDQKSQFSAILLQLVDFNPFIWTADKLLMLGLVPTYLRDQFLTLNITHQGSLGPFLVVDLTKGGGTSTYSMCGPQYLGVIMHAIKSIGSLMKNNARRVWVVSCGFFKRLMFIICFIGLLMFF